MFEVSHILTPVDRSDGARIAFRMAQYLAGRYGAALRWTHVVPPIPSLFQHVLFPYAGMGEDHAEFEDELLETASNKFNELFGRKGEDKPSGSVTRAEVVDGIVEEIGRFGPELVVIGAHGDTGTRPQHIGHIANRFLSRWVGPTLVARPFSGDQPFKSLLVVTDFSPGSEALLSAAAGLGVVCGVPITVVTVIEDPRSYDAGGLISGALKIDANRLKSTGEKNARKQMSQLMSALEVPFPRREAFAEVKPRGKALFGAVLDQVQETVQELDDPLVIVGRAKKTPGEDQRLGTTAEAIVRYVPAHALVVPLT